MRIGITCYPTVGGSGVVAAELGHAMAARGHQVHFICYAPPFRMREAPNVHFHPIAIPQYPLFEYPSYGMAAASKMAQIARAYDLDVLHVHYAYPHGVSAWLARQISDLPRLKTVVTLHGTDITLVGQDEAFYLLTRFALEHCDAITGVSRYLARKTRSWFGIRRSIHVIPNFVDTALFAPPAEPGPSEKMMVHVSNFRPVKRSLDPIRVLERVRRSVPARLIMIGTGPELENARRLAHELALTEAVEFAGDVRDVPSMVSRADFLISTSEVEGFGLAPLEAMSCGIPVVATKTGGLPELITDGVHGFLCPVGDISAMAERSVEIMRDPSLRASLGQAGRGRAMQHYDLQQIVPQYERLYEKVVQETRTDSLR